LKYLDRELGDGAGSSTCSDSSFKSKDDEVVVSGKRLTPETPLVILTSMSGVWKIRDITEKVDMIKEYRNYIVAWVYY
jgi:hypothetical protein